MPVELLNETIKHPPASKLLHSRIIVDFYFEGTEGVGVAQASDLNVNGLYFNTLTIIPKGTRLQLRLPLPESKEGVLVEAEVVYSQPQIGCAVEFVGLSKETHSALMQFIERQIKEKQAPEATETQVHCTSVEQQPDPLRRREYQWVREHQDEYAGHYVIVEGDRLIAHGLDGRRVLVEAQKAGIKIPFLVHIAPSDEPPFGGW